MRIVKMKREHTRPLAELEKQCFAHPWSQEALEAEIDNPAACFFTALGEDGQVLGYGGMHSACGEFYMDNVAVFGRCRGKGVGTALVSALWEEVLKQKGEFLSLEVRPSNRQALELYQRLGFLEEGRRKGFYRDPLEDALILTKHGTPSNGPGDCLECAERKAKGHAAVGN